MRDEPEAGEQAFNEGFLLGILVGEGHFGGDGRQPQVTLRMHVRHESLFRWILETFPGGRLFGPYHHGGRNYYQWMARGAFLRDTLLPLLERRLTPMIDQKTFEAVRAMRTRYASQTQPEPRHESRPPTAEPQPSDGEARPAL